MDNDNAHLDEVTKSSSDHPKVAGKYLPALVLFVLVCLLALAGDQSLKYLSFAYIPEQNPITAPPPERTAILINAPTVTVVPAILSLKLTINRGAVFGLGQGRRWVFVFVSIIAILVIGFIFYRSDSRSWISHIGLALILAGALGNLWDRIIFGAVRDMLWLFPGTNLWPWIFNLADVSLLCGVAIMLLTMWAKEGDKK